METLDNQLYLEDEYIPTQTQFKLKECEHKSYCANNIHKFSMKCIFGVNECKVKKYYNKYGPGGNFLGI